MAKLPTALLPRSLPSTSSGAFPSSSSTTLFTCSATHRPTATATASSSAVLLASLRPIQQVRHATAVERPKRPFTWTQIIQLSDGSTFTTRTTTPFPVFRSTKDTRNHARWQPTNASLQNVEVDEAGKLARFRQRFGGAFDLAPGQAMTDKAPSREQAAAAARANVGKGGKKKADELKKAEEEKKAAAAEAEAEAAKIGEEDMFTDLMASYVIDEPQLRGGKIASKDSKKGKKK